MTRGVNKTSTGYTPSSAGGNDALDVQTGLVVSRIYRAGPSLPPPPHYDRGYLNSTF